MKADMGRNFWKRAGLHLVLWVSLWFTLALLMSGTDNLDFGLRRSFFIIVGQAVLVYVNSQVLMPRFFFSKRYWLYGLLTLAAILLVSYCAQELIDQYAGFSFERGSGRPRGRSFPFHSTWKFMSRSFPFFIALIIGSVYEVANLANRQERETVQLKNEKLQTELKFLRSQTNPHFLFNALHNIYSLSVLKSERTPDYLLKLSEMLRYMLYEANAEFVPLQKEVDYLKNYVDLQLLKDSRGLNVKLDIPEPCPELQIAPLLFVPFVENAFKHSRVEDRTTGWIFIGLTVEGKRLRLEVKNSLPERASTKDQTGGIGLTNVWRQLELLYPDRHELVVSSEGGTYSAVLNLNLA